jgi:hypothetical protein
MVIISAIPATAGGIDWRIAIRGRIRGQKPKTLFKNK